MKGVGRAAESECFASCLNLWVGMFLAMCKCLVNEELPSRGKLHVIEMADLTDASLMQLGHEICSPRVDCAEIMIKDPNGFCLHLSLVSSCKTFGKNRVHDV